MSHLTSLLGLRFHIVQALRVGFLAGLLGGCAPPFDDGGTSENDGVRDDDESALSSRTRYVPIEQALPKGKRLAWDALRARLFEQFDEICGDTFCEGDWSNLEPLDLSCSATVATGTVRECVWTFAASDELVHAGDGTIQTNMPFFSCRVRPHARAEAFLDALGDDPLHAPVPGLDVSLYDAIGECFETPSGATPFEDAPVDGFYVDVRQGLDDETIDAWYTLTSALKAAYVSESKGDRDPRPLRLICSQDQNTRDIGECSWSFAEAETRVGSAGLHRVREQRHVCAFRPDGTPLELAQALTKTEESDVPGDEPSPLDRPLPNSDLTMRAILDDCW